jgi:hypothetical protein
MYEIGIDVMTGRDRGREHKRRMWILKLLAFFSIKI